MTTVVDELILKFSLDPSNFNKGQQQTVQNLRKMEEEARSAGKGTEEAAKKMADGFERVTKEVLSLGAAFLGVNGLKDLAVSTTTNAANLGVLTQALNVNAEALNRWQNAGRHAGISVEQTAASIANFQTKLQQFRTRQIGPEGIGLRALNALAGITTNDLFTQDWETLLKRISAGVRAHPQAAAGLLAETPIAGLQGTLQRADLDELLRNGQTITREQIAAASEIRDIFVDTATKLEAKVNSWLPGWVKPARGITSGIDQIAEGNILHGANLIDKGTGSDLLGSFINRINPFAHKPDAGNFNEGTAALSAWLAANVGGFNQITAANDAYHGGRGGHGAGLAVDFTLKGASAEQYALTAAGLNRSGLGLKAINEFAPGSSPGWTAPHLHVQFRDREAAESFARDHPAGQGNSTTVGTVNVYTQPGADPHAIGQAVKGAIQSPQATQGAN